MLVQAQNNNTHFTSTPINYVNLKKAGSAGEGFVKAVFSKLDPKDSIDRNAIKKVQKTWSQDDFSTQEFCQNFLDETESSKAYYCVELTQEKSLGERIVGIVKANFLKSFDGEKSVYLSLMASKPNLSHASTNRKISGVGEIMLAEVFNKAKRADCNALTFNSLDDSFYLNTFTKANLDAAKLKKIDRFSNYKFFISNEKFNDYINYCQNKYKTDFSANI